MLQIIGALIAGLGVGFCLGGLYEMRNKKRYKCGTRDRRGVANTRPKK